MGDPRGRSLPAFTWEKSPLSRKFRTARNTNDFMAIWDKEVLPYLDKSTGNFLAPEEAFPTCGSAMSEEIPAPAPKRVKNDQDEMIDKAIEECYSGK
jgi:hypothetical protein